MPHTGRYKDYQTARKYWNKLKQRLRDEGDELVTICHQLKLKAEDGKMRLTDVADTQHLLRIIQSIPSPKAEPFKQWMASVAANRLDQMQDPELNFEQAYADYRRLGYSDKWLRSGALLFLRPKPQTICLLLKIRNCLKGSRRITGGDKYGIHSR